MPYRPTRTRIYDANFNKGHSLYKPALDSIDRKYSLPNTIRDITRPTINFGLDIGEGMSDARHRAHRAITEETVFDSRGFKVPKVGIPLGSQFEKNFDAEIETSLDRIRTNKLKTINADIDLDLPKLSSYTRRARAAAEFGDSLYGADAESSNYVKKRALKVIESSAVETALDTNNLTKWTKIGHTEDSHSLASKRAHDSALRLQELEDDMQSREERQLARERRAANLRRIVHEDFNNEDLKAITFN